jgi:uncharacterized membrane protein
MNYNIHPILVHFPIALLFIYSIIKVLPLKKWLPEVFWKHIEIALLVFGFLGALAANATGEIAEHLINPVRMLVETHSTFAAVSIGLYGTILAGEVLHFLNLNYKKYIPAGIVQKCVDFFEKLLCNNFVSKILAVFGFVAITVTGLLGGVMVYGTTADPLAGIVLKLLGINI